MRFHVVVAAVGLSLCLLGDAGDGELLAGPLNLAAPKYSRPAGAPRPSDICFSSRWPRPLDKTDSHDTFAAAKSFRATRIDWNYPTRVEFIQKVKREGYTYFGTISAELDGAHATEEGRDKSYAGNVVGNPELDFLAARGDVSSRSYRNVVLQHVIRILDGGADGIFVDDPGMTYHNALYNRGGYGDAAMDAFRDFLVKRSTFAQKSEWGLPDDLDKLDYAGYVRGKQGQVPDDLKALFFEFHKEAVDEFYKWLRSETDRRAGRHVPFACNNWSVHKQDEFPFREHFDFWIGETSVQYAKPTAKLIHEKVRHAAELGKWQYFSPPNDGPDFIPTREEYVQLTRRLIATSYACGSATLVPWDVWRRGASTPRFFGTPEEFGDLYQLVSDHPEFFDRQTQIFASGGGVATQAAEGVPEDLVHAAKGTNDLFLTVRAEPGNVLSPIVIHVVDWSTEPAENVLSLKNTSFGGRASDPLECSLLLPGKPVQQIAATLTDGGRSLLSVSQSTPWSIVVVQQSPATR